MPNGHQDKSIDHAVTYAKFGMQTGMLLNGGALLALPAFVGMVRGCIDPSSRPELQALELAGCNFLAGLSFAIAGVFLGYLHFKCIQARHSGDDPYKVWKKLTGFMEISGFFVVLLSLVAFSFGAFQGLSAVNSYCVQ